DDCARKHEPGRRSPASLPPPQPNHSTRRHGLRKTASVPTLSPTTERPIPMSASTEEYTPPKVWSWNKASGGRFANINRPIAGPTHDKELPVGKHPMQLYSLGTPNGQKVTVMLEELLALGKKGAEYDAWLIRIGDRDQFGRGFVATT